MLVALFGGGLQLKRCSGHTNHQRESKHYYSINSVVLRAVTVPSTHTQVDHIILTVGGSITIVNTGNIVNTDIHCVCKQKIIICVL